VNTGTIRFRNIEVKEFAAESSSSRPQAAPPPNAQDVADKAYEKACSEARAKLLTAFDRVLDNLAKSKASTEARLKLIDVIKEEKSRFDNRGLIPWSDPNFPGGVAIDSLQVSADGMTYSGTNNDQPQRRPKLTGVYRKDG
jgi:hypothetical protein